MRVKRYTCVKNKEGRVFLRCLQEYPFSGEVEFNTPEVIHRFARDTLGLCDLAEEEMWLFAFNTKNKPIGLFKVSHGGVNYTVVGPREVYIRVLLIGAVNIILVHNHPSGDVTPSKDDDNLTKKMKEAADLLHINLLDHIIVGNTFYSYRRYCKI